MIKKSLLDSLVGMKVADAQKEVFLAGHEFETIPHDAARIALAVPNTVLLWEEKGLVKLSEAGDPLEVDTSPEVVVQ